MRTTISEGHGGTHGPNFPVEEGVLDKGILVLVARTVPVQEQTVFEEGPLVRCEPFGRLGIVGQHPKADDGDDNSSDTFEDEDPAL